MYYVVPNNRPSLNNRPGTKVPPGHIFSLSQIIVLRGIFKYETFFEYRADMRPSRVWTSKLGWDVLKLFKYSIF